MSCCRKIPAKTNWFIISHLQPPFADSELDSDPGDRVVVRDSGTNYSEIHRHVHQRQLTDRAWTAGDRNPTRAVKELECFVLRSVPF